MHATTSPGDDHAHPDRLPCGCDPNELAARLGLSVDDLIRTFEASQCGESGPDGRILITGPWPPIDLVRGAEN